MKTICRRPALAAAMVLSAVPVLAQAQAPRVEVDTAERAAIVEEVPLTGTVTSPRVAQVSTAIGGLVETVAVEVGDRVEQGKVLVTLDRELEALALEAARAAAAQARVELADARRRLAEALELEARQTIPVTELRSLESEVEADSAALARLTAEQKRQAARLRRHEVVAPFAGVVSRRLTEAGEWIEPGTAVLELIATDALRIDFQVPQDHFARIDGHTRLEVTPAATPGQAVAARIGAIVPVNDPSARTFLLRAYLVDDEVPITHGMSAHGVLRLQTDRRGVVVPRDALLRYPDGRVVVWLVDGEGGGATVTERQVETGLGFGGKVEITAGLEPGARVVTAGNEALQEGQPVRVAGAD